jgi:4-hydroxybenzoyl-CoA reductase subunit alpha
MLVQIAAQELGLPMEEIRLISADTETTPTDAGCYSMVTTFAGGNAVRLAAQDAKLQLFDVAAEMMGAEPEDLVARDGQILIEGESPTGIPIRKVVRKALLEDKPIMGRGHYTPHVDHTREWIKKRVLEVTAAQDCGYAINPMIVEGQFEGGVAMGGQGGVLTEGHQWAGGHMFNPTYREYKIPLACDMPHINPIIVESLDPNGPYGAKEAGMSIAMSAAQAYCNAICNAIGTWIQELPFTPETILRAIETKEGRSSGEQAR